MQGGVQWQMGLFVYGGGGESNAGKLKGYVILTTHTLAL